ncbi:ABC transporter permease [Sulfitobacter porphyrae]|uniref:ABC transporter permease n=1 Tax=Sulfitobacter porphyrae TaxID=1246864 RepID=A0ABW2BBH6_9RHOB
MLAMSFSSDPFLAFPPTSFSLQWYEEFFSDSSWINALGKSLMIALVSTALACVLGVLAAYGLDRSPTLASGLMPVLMTPVIVPIIVVAVALYGGFVNWGLIGTDAGLVLAHTLGGQLRGHYRQRHARRI